MNFFTSWDVMKYKDKSKPIPCSLEWFSTATQPVYLFGAGSYGMHALTILKHQPPYVIDKVKGFLDKNPQRIRYHSYPVYEPKFPKKNQKNPLVIVAAQPRSAAESQIVKKCQHFGYEYVTYGEFAINIRLAAKRGSIESLENNTEAVRALDIWADTKSHNTYKNLLKVRVNLDEEYLPMGEPSQYFLPLVPDKYYRSFVDCGAYDGQTMKELRDYTSNNFDNYYAVEGNENALPKLRRAIGNDPRIHIFPLVLSDSKGTVNFDTSGVCGAISANTGSPVPTDTIDNVFADKIVTSVKMDIEGAEIAALKGAMKTIKTQRPALIISIYHRPEDIWSIPLWIHDLDLGYFLYCRHHKHYNLLCETVCYAVPS